MTSHGEHNYEDLGKNFTGTVLASESGRDHAAAGDLVHRVQPDEPLAYDPLYSRELSAAAVKFDLDLSPKQLWEQGRDLVIAAIGKSVETAVGIDPYLKAVSPLDLLHYFSYCVKHNLNPLSESVGIGFDRESLRLYPQITHQGFLRISRIAPCVSEVRFSFSGLRRASFSYTKEIFDPTSGKKLPQTVKADRDYFLSCTCSFKRGDRAYSATAFFDELFIPDCEPWAVRPKELLSHKAFDRAVAIAYELTEESLVTGENLRIPSGIPAAEPLKLTVLPEGSDGAAWEIKGACAVPVEELSYEDLAAVIKMQTLSLGIDLILDQLKKPLLQLSDYEQTRLILLACKLKLDLMSRERAVPAGWKTE